LKKWCGGDGNPVSPAPGAVHLATGLVLVGSGMTMQRKKIE